MSDPTYLLRTIPAGATIKRHEQHPSGLPIVIEWEEADGSIHIMKLLRDNDSPVGFCVDEIVATTDAKAELTFGTLDERSEQTQQRTGE